MSVMSEIDIEMHSYETKIDERYYINVKDLMYKELPRPRLKRTVFVTGWGEWLPLITL